MYLKRSCEDIMKKMAGSFPCIAVYGSRQVGKSTTVRMLFGDDFSYVTLDNLEDRNLAVNNPRLFLEMNPWPLVIDEIQKAPMLMDEMKIIIDEQRMRWMREDGQRRLMYVITCSNQFELKQGISDSLAGRIGIVRMNSFSLCEKKGERGELFHPEITGLLKRERESKVNPMTRMEVFEEIFRGGMPDVLTGNSDRASYFEAYIQTYLERDVKNLINARMELTFRNFLGIVALRTGQELRYDAIANSVGIDVRTCKRWISILASSGIIYLVRPYLTNRSKRIIKAPKLYFMDTGLCSYLCRWQDARMLESGAMSGAMFETFAVSEIIKSFHSFGRNPEECIYYYRDTDGKEVDLLYVERDSIYPIEVKKGINPSKPTKNFKVLNKYGMEIKRGLVIETCDRIRPINDFAWTFPVHLLGI